MVGCCAQRCWVLLPKGIPRQVGYHGSAHRMLVPAPEMTRSESAKEWAELKSRKCPKGHTHPTGKNVLSFEERCSLQPSFTTVEFQKLKEEELFLYMLLHQYSCLTEETRRHSLKSNKAKQIFEPTSWSSA